MLNSNKEGEANAFIEDEGEDEEEDKETEENPLNYLKTISKLKPARRKRFPWSESLDRYFTFVNFLMEMHMCTASFNLIKFEIPLTIKNGGPICWNWIFIFHPCALQLLIFFPFETLQLPFV